MEAQRIRQFLQCRRDDAGAPRNPDLARDLRSLRAKVDSLAGLGLGSVELSDELVNLMDRPALDAVA